MATREIKTRFALEGEQKFKSAMKESANAIKVLNSQEKLAKATFKQTGDAEKYNAQQTQILKQKIEEQKNAVAAAEQAIKALTANGVAPNAKSMQDWQVKLNNAQTALVKMETDLQSFSSETNNAETQTESLGNSIEDLDKKSSLETLIAGAGKITSAFEGAVSKVKELAVDLVNAMKDAASWADDLATQAIVYGTDVETLQRMRNAAQLIDTDVETIVKARQKLEQAMKSGSEETEEAFALFGVHTKRYGQFRDWEDVFWETGEAMMHMTDGLDGMAKTNAEVERDTAAMKLFGKSWRELIPLFTAGQEGYNKAMQESSVVTAEDVGKLTELDDALQKLQAEFTTLEMTVAASLAPTLTDLAEALKKALQELNTYLQSEEGQAKLKELSEAIQGFFSGIKDIDFSNALDTAKNALDDLKEALEWIKNNKDAVITGITGIVTAWGALKVSSGVATFLQLVAGWKGAFGGSAAATAASAKAAGAAVGSSWGAGFAGAVAKAVPWLAGLALLFENAVKPQGNDDILTAEEEKAVQEGKITPEIQAKIDSANELYNAGGWGMDANGNWVPLEKGEVTSSEGKPEIVDDVDLDNAEKMLDLTEAQTAAAQKYWDVLRNNPTPEQEMFAYQDLFDAFDDGSIDGMANLEKLMSLIDSLPKSFENLPDFWFAGASMVTDVTNGVNEESGNLENAAGVAGANAAIGLANGINNNAAAAVNAATALANAVSVALRSALKISSPSKVMAELGGYVSTGFAQGIEDNLGVVTRAADRMAGAVANNPDTGTGIYGSGSMSKDGRMIDVTLMLGPEKLTEVMVPLVNEAIGEEVNLMRR